MNNYGEKSLFGFWLYILSDCMLFASLFAVFAVLRGQTYGGITNSGVLNLPFLLAETLILLTSSYTMGLAVVVASNAKKNKTLLYVFLFITLFLGLTFLGMEGYEFHSLIAEGNTPARSAFLSSFFTLVGTHGLHVFVGILWMVALMMYTYRQGLTEGNVRKLKMLALFWHFLDIIWIFIFSIVYLLTSAL
ncbi:MAG: cytochrome o ubiquinol oxidase subunit [Candidatus Adlerbacteria bacterium]|nr:cytochrome o ubiquinol oxidase subunit [Candidatus Adlerbacteria bacterium]